MSKIYKRATLPVSKGSKKKDEHNRTRNVILNFRVTPEEKEQIEARIALSGLTKADYFIRSTLYQKLEIYGNIRIYKQMRSDMLRIEETLSQMKVHGDIDPVTETKWMTLCEMMEGWKMYER